ncbi:group-specific protein [Bacillus sp. REN10]|uniref:group-specific protein n=1 Tax=Bacillus sp. REN10 TaxID=2782541 RepID=UPI00193BF6CA|nr:group-specific protein [Bacillus sp. REN10]
MIQIQVDQKELKKLYLEEIQKRLDQIDHSVTFWDTKELKRQTNMSWNTIQDMFFHDPRFPKFNTGNKWYFPAKECRAFLIRWAEENSYKFKSNLSKEVS